MSGFDSSTVVDGILVVIAMEAEAAPLLTKLNLPEIAAEAPNATYKLYSGNYNGVKLSVVTNGKCKQFGVDNVGTTPAALSTFLAINQVSPKVVLNAGTAGGFAKKGAAIGDAYIGSVLKHHDRRIPIPGFTEYGIGNHVGLSCPQLVQALNMKVGVITTSNSLDHTDMDDKIMAENDASVKDMEAAAIAWAASLSGTPLISLKVVTDIVDGDRPTQEEFLENLASAAASLQDKVPKVIDFLVGKRLGDL